MATGWPFWAATSDERIEMAFELAELASGEHLVDLGCGDGRVLLRAADRGARVTGIEIDPELCAKARRLLAHYGFDGRIIKGDIATSLVALAASDDPPDVVFAYLSPATLQRLRPSLSLLTPATRVVVAGWSVPGWDVDAVAERCFLYRMPASLAPAPLLAAGQWESDGLVVSMPADAPSLVATRFRHPGGVVRAGVAGDLCGVVDVLAGATAADPDEVVVLDLRWQAAVTGTVVNGSVEVDGLTPFEVIGIIGVGESGMWGVQREGIDQLRALMERRGPEAVLDAARSSGSRETPPHE